MNLFIVASIDPFHAEAGGTKSFVMGMLNSLSCRGYLPTLVGLTHTDSREMIPDKFRFIPVLNTNNSKVSSYYFLFQLFLKVSFMHISSNTIIHVQREDHLLPFILFCRRNPKLCTLHGNSADKMYLKKGKLVGRIYIEVEKFALIRVDKIIAVDKGTRDYYVSKYKWLDEKIEVVPIGIDLTLFRPMPKNEMKKKYGLEYEKIIVFIGRQEKEKNLHFLLNAFKNLKYEKRSCCLLLVGSGREHDALKEEAFRQNLKNVVFMDTLEHKYIPEILNCADVFALCSLFESGPLVVQEAIACGVPVVSTNVGRVKDFIADEHIGKIVDYDEIEFARALDTYLSLGSNDIAHIRGIAENFSFNKTADSFIEIYKKLSKNGKLV